MKELGIESKDLEVKFANHILLKEDKTKFKRTDTDRKKMVMSEAERKNIFDRMDNFHAKLRENLELKNYYK